MHPLRELERISRGRLEIPRASNFNHILLASYPKSGNTWLRFILANISRQMGGHKPEVDFHTLDRYVPVIRVNRHLAGRIETLNFPLFLKTHFPWVRGFRAYPSVVLIRDPADTLVSYYRHLSEGAGKRLPELSRFIRHWRYGAPAWSDWYRSWQNRHQALVRYEDLLEEPGSVLQRMFGELGVEVPESIVEESISLSSRDRMRRLQAERGDPNLRNPSFQFVKRARAGAGRETMSEADLRYVRRATASVAREYGYADESEVASE